MKSALNILFRWIQNDSDWCIVRQHFVFARLIEVLICDTYNKQYWFFFNQKIYQIRDKSNSSHFNLGPALQLARSNPPVAIVVLLFIVYHYYFYICVITNFLQQSFHILVLIGVAIVAGQPVLKIVMQIFSTRIAIFFIVFVVANLSFLQSLQQLFTLDFWNKLADCNNCRCLEHFEHWNEEEKKNTGQINLYILKFWFSVPDSIRNSVQCSDSQWKHTNNVLILSSR